jgi:hypothetical protein
MVDLLMNVLAWKRGSRIGMKLYFVWPSRKSRKRGIQICIFV